MKNRKGLIICLMLILSFLITFPSINSLELGDITLTDWDGVPAGADSGTEGFIDFINTGTTDYMEVTSSWSESGDHSLKVKLDDSGDGTGYINITETYDYISSFFIETRKGTVTNDLEQYVQLDFKNNNIDVLKLRFIQSTQAKIQSYNVGTSSWEEIANYATYGDHLKLKVTHNNTNSMWFRVYNDTDDLVISNTKSSSSSTDWTTFDQIVISTYSPPTSGLIFYFDDIVININEKEDDLPKVNGISVWQNGVSGIYDVEVRSIVYYSVYIHGDENCKGIITIRDSFDGEIIYIASNIDRGWHNFTVYYETLYGNGSFRFYAADSRYTTSNPSGEGLYNVEEYFNVTGEWFDPEFFEDVYGNRTLAEFYQYKVPCRYYVGGSFDVITFIKSSDLIDYDYFIYKIYSLNKNKYVISRNIYYNDTWFIHTNPWKIDSSGDYQIKLFGYNETTKTETYFSESQIVYVCTDNEKNVIDPDLTTDGDDVEQFVGIDSDVWWLIVGLVIVCFGFIAPSLIGNNLRHPLPKEVNIFTGVTAMVGCTFFGFFEIWVLFVFALMIVAYIIINIGGR